MALEVLRVPNFEYSGFYYPQIAARLRRWARIYAPEITNEDFREIFIQLERAFSLMAHYNNVLLDMVANDMFLPTARLPESVKLLLSLINYRMLPASPAQVEMLAKLSRTYTSTTRLLELNRKFATTRNPDIPELLFENTDVLDTTARTDQISEAYTMTKDRDIGCSTSSLVPDVIQFTSGTIFTISDLGRYVFIYNSVLGNNGEDFRITELLDETSSGSGNYNQARLQGASFVSENGLVASISDVSANKATDLVAGTPTTLFAAPAIGNKFYFGHADIMFDRFDVTLDTVALGLGAVWEFYDPSETTLEPDGVEIDPPANTGTTKFDLTSILGVEDRSWALVRVMHLSSGNESNAYSTIDNDAGSSTYNRNVVYIEGYFGQAVPSTNISDYLIYMDWRPIDIIVDDTKSSGVTWAQDGKITYNIPQTQDDNWQKFSLYDSSSGLVKTAYFLRLRLTNVLGGPTGPVPDGLTINQGSQYVLPTLIQGQTVEDDPLGSSSGEPSQQFTLTRSPYIDESVRVFIDEGGGDIEWSSVTTFLTSIAADRHFIVDVQTDGTAIILFGDGINGRIPPIGTNNIRAIYRIGADQDGNIGAGTLTVNRDGVGVFKEITNPRSGEFWVEADWDSQDALERVKRDGPLQLRTMFRAVAPRDCEILARAFQTTDGVKPVERAKAYEEAYGPKTVGLIVAGRGGAALDQDSRESLTEFFNGGDDFGGVLVVNHEVVVANYVPKLIGYNVEITANANVTEELILQTLQALISPSALEEDRVSYVWDFGQEVPNSRVNSQIFRASIGNIFKVVFNSPTTDVALAQKELPVLDTSNTNIVIIPPSF